MKAKPLPMTDFYSKMVPPKLIKIHFSKDGREIKAIDYHNPGDQQNIHHLILNGAKAFQILLEEAFSNTKEMEAWLEGDHAIMEIENSPWRNDLKLGQLRQFKHFQVNFQQAIIDVFCKDVRSQKGRFNGSTI